MTIRTNYNSPPRVIVGDYLRDIHAGCAETIISWELGDKRITAYPSNTYRPLAEAMHLINDNGCPETTRGKPRKGLGTGVRYLCPTHASAVLDLAHRYTGTAKAPKAQEWRFMRELLVGEHGLIGMAENMQHADYMAHAAELANSRAEGRGVDRHAIPSSPFVADWLTLPAVALMAADQVVKAVLSGREIPTSWACNAAQGFLTAHAGGLRLWGVAEPAKLWPAGGYLIDAFDRAGSQPAADRELISA